MKKYFPLSVKAKGSIGNLIVSLIIYCGCFYLIKVLCGTVGRLPLLNIIAPVVQYVVWLYCIVGVIAALLYFFKLIK